MSPTPTSTAGSTTRRTPSSNVSLRISSTGQSLDSSIQRTMEDRMGDSFGDVQIHTGAQAAAACESINARAFTVGNHIAFNSGEYDPESEEGQHVLAHELAHVRQQTGGAVSMLPQEDLEMEIDPDPALEREAEETAQRVVHGWKADIQQMPYTGVHVQRLKNDIVNGVFRIEHNEKQSTNLNRNDEKSKPSAKIDAILQRQPKEGFSKKRDLRQQRSYERHLLMSKITGMKTDPEMSLMLKCRLMMTPTDWWL